ncbi:MAG: hypothetical protein ACTSQQ_01960 [Candidatus Helarchaeota archaeon]
MAILNLVYNFSLCMKTSAIEVETVGVKGNIGSDFSIYVFSDYFLRFEGNIKIIFAITDNQGARVPVKFTTI